MARVALKVPERLLNRSTSPVKPVVYRQACKLGSSRRCEFQRKRSLPRHEVSSLLVARLVVSIVFEVAEVDRVCLTRRFDAPA
jgi:hypothetical protein